MITDAVKRMLHGVAKLKRGNAELPYTPEKKSVSEFFKGVWNDSRRIYCTNFKFKNRSYPAETEQKNTKKIAKQFLVE